MAVFPQVRYIFKKPVNSLISNVLRCLISYFVQLLWATREGWNLFIYLQIYIYSIINCIIFILNIKLYISRIHYNASLLFSIVYKCILIQ